MQRRHTRSWSRNRCPTVFHKPDEIDYAPCADLLVEDITNRRESCRKGRGSAVFSPARRATGSVGHFGDIPSVQCWCSLFQGLGGCIQWLPLGVWQRQSPATESGSDRVGLLRRRVWSRSASRGRVPPEPPGHVLGLMVLAHAALLVRQSRCSLPCLTFMVGWMVPCCLGLHFWLWGPCHEQSSHCLNGCKLRRFILCLVVEIALSVPHAFCLLGLPGADEEPFTSLVLCSISFSAKVIHGVRYLSILQGSFPQRLGVCNRVDELLISESDNRPSVLLASERGDPSGSQQIISHFHTNR